MSWDKNTINNSEIDRLVDLIKDLKTKYKLTVLATVNGRGNNDDGTEYKLRKLEYKNTVIIEQMVQTTDCDTDDTIITLKFEKNKIPKNFKSIVRIDNN